MASRPSPSPAEPATGKRFPITGAIAASTIGAAALLAWTPAVVGWPVVLISAALLAGYSVRRWHASQLQVKLEMAIVEGDAEQAEALIRQGAPVQPSEGCHPLYLASAQGLSGTVGGLLARGADPNVPAQGIPPLAAAALRGHAETAGLLLRHGADPHRRCENERIPEDLQGGTALHGAACGGHRAVVALLLEAGADPRLQSRTGKTALALARDNGQRQSEALLSEALATDEETLRAPTTAVESPDKGSGAPGEQP